MRYAVDLNLDIPVLSSNITLDEIPKEPHTRLYPDTHLNPDLIKLMSDLSLDVSFAESFYMPRYTKSIIHCDTKLFTDIAKINFVYYGMNSLMNWYKANDEDLRETNPSVIGSNYRKYDINEVTLIHSQYIGCPALVQAGVPHNVTTLRERRLCISLFLIDKLTGKYLTFNDSIERFDKFMPNK